VGAKLVRAALKVDKVRPRARLVLVTMSVLAFDAPRGNRPAGVYYGGRMMLLGEMGQLPTDANLRELQRDLAELRKAGLIEQIRKPGPDTTAAYRLCITIR
jgi:hypothetical protein